ncbi:MAG TPA: hypothetical protein VH482_00645 [Thermomicrobiales bacterium]
MTLPAVIRMVITECKVAPQRHDWREMLDRAGDVFRVEAPNRFFPPGTRCDRQLNDLLPEDFAGEQGRL